MPSNDLHEVVFEWPHPEPSVVIVTGTFDQWSSSIHLTKTSAGFSGSTKIPWGEKIQYKFIVDGQWIVHGNKPTEIEYGGFVNNIYTAPPKPQVPTSSTSNGNAAKDEEREGSQVAVFPQILSDLASTVIAREGTSSALGYVTSGLGAAVHSVVGVDPINTGHISIPTPKVDEGFNVPSSASTVGPEPELISTSLDQVSPSSSSPETPPSPIAPRVPIMIVPVNAAENSTVGSPPSSSQPEFILPPSRTAVAHLAQSLSEMDADTVLIEEQPVAPTATKDVNYGSAPVADTLLPEDDLAAFPVAVDSELAIKLEEAEVEQADTLASMSTVQEPSKPKKISLVEESSTIIELKAGETPSNDTIPAAVVIEDAATSPALDEQAVIKSDGSKEDAVVPAEVQPDTNGRPLAPKTPAKENGKDSIATPIPTAPSTPSKQQKKVFPRSESPSSLISSPSSSKFSTQGSARKKRTSIFGKFSLKNIFHHDKDKERANEKK